MHSSYQNTFVKTVGGCGDQQRLQRPADAGRSGGGLLDLPSNRQYGAISFLLILTETGAAGLIIFLTFFQ